MLAVSFGGIFLRGARPTLACYRVHEGFAQCKVGFLPHHLVVHAANYAGILLQITEVLSEDDSDVWKAEKLKKSRMLLCKSSKENIGDYGVQIQN